MTQPNSPRSLNESDSNDSRIDLPNLLTGNHSRSPSTIVLHGSELIAFTSSLRELIRLNQDRAIRQAALNDTNAQLHAMNFFMHYCNAERSQKLERDYMSVRNSLERGREMLQHMSTVIAHQDATLNELGQSVSSLRQQAEEHSIRVGEIEDAMAEQKMQLAHAMSEYEQRLSAQEAQFRQQEAVLARLLSVRFKMDFGIDMLILLVAWYGSHNNFSATLLDFFGRNLLFRAAAGRRARNRQTRWFITAVQMVTFFGLIVRLREVARSQGWHHSIGGYGKYVEFAAKTTGAAIEMVRGGGRRVLTLEEDDSEATGHSSDAALVSTDPSSSSSTSSPVPPSYRSSAASSLGRRVGSIMLTVAGQGRDVAKAILNRVVGTGAGREMDFDTYPTTTTANPAETSSTSSPKSGHTKNSTTTTKKSHSTLNSPIHATNTHQQSSADNLTTDSTIPLHYPLPNPSAPSVTDLLH